MLNKNQERSLEGELGSKWRDGVFLSFSRDSNGYFLWAVGKKNVVRARGLERKPESTRCSADS